jgi:hypothetical protein
MKQRDVESLRKLIDMPDSAFFNLDEQAAADLGDQAANLVASEGLTIATPKEVVLEQRTTIPFLVLSWISNLRKWEVVGPRNRQVIVVDLQSGKATTHDPYAGPRREDLRQVPKSRQGKPEDVAAPKGFSGGCELLDMKSFANLPWKPGKYAATWIQYDWKSNTQLVDLIPAKAASPEGKEEWLHALRIPYGDAVEMAYAFQKMVQSPYPALTLASTPQTPKPSSPGIVLDVPSAFSLKPKPWIVHGAARLELLPGHFVAKPDSGFALPEKRVAPPPALVSISLLVATLDQPLRKVDFQIPVNPLSHESHFSVGDTIDLALQIDLKAALHTELPKGEYQLFAVAGSQVSGPYPFTVSQ